MLKSYFATFQPKMANHPSLGKFILIYQRFSFLAQSTAPANAAQSQGAKLESILFCNAAAVLLLNEAESENATLAKNN
jgi:hypothetical protein